MLIAFSMAVCVGLAPLQAWTKDEAAKTPKIAELMKDADAFMSQAQNAYIDGQTKEAIELYRKALASIADVEEKNGDRVATSEFAPLRFRKALCETEIDRIMLEDVSSKARTVAVTDTTALELKRAERKKAAETNSVPDTAKELVSKQGVSPDPLASDTPKSETPEPEAKAAPVVATLAPTNGVAAAPQLVNVSKDLEWAKDMISVERYDDAEKALLGVLKQVPNNREARFLMAYSRMLQDRPVDAAVIIDDLLADNPGDEAVLLLAAGIFTSSGHYAKAMDALDKSMKANPKRPDGYRNMAWLLIEMNPNGVDEAEMYYRQSVKLGCARDREIERRLGIKAD
jgi:tetratricopeptide (TPR) repeat protein